MGLNDGGNSDASLGYVNMVRTFMRAGLQPPFIPKSLWPKIIVQENWCWGTQTVDSFGMYIMRDYIVNLLQQVGNYVAISHAGHGISSYGLQFAISYGPLMVVVQNCFGGAYSDHSYEFRSISRTYNQVMKLLKAISPTFAGRRYQKRIILIWSEFRGFCQLAVQDGMVNSGHLANVIDNQKDRELTEHDIVSADTSLQDESTDGRGWVRFTDQADLFAAAGLALEELLKEGQQ